MISLHNILSIAKYERKTLLRSWFFRIFSIVSLWFVFGFNFGMIINNVGDQGWAIRAIPSAIPYFNLLILNVGQAIIAVFLASDFLKRDKKLDTTEVIYMRSMTNGEYVIGKTWGNLQVFLILNVIVVIMALLFNALAKDIAIDFVSYGIYLVLISVPTLVFIMGLSFLLMSIIRNQAITFVLILGYIGITLFVAQAKFYYIFDYMAFNIPMLSSDIVGFGNLNVILAHRGIYFALGMGFIFLTIFLLKRLPQSDSMTLFSLIFGVIFIAGGGYLAYSHISRFKQTEKLRAEVVELNNKYVKQKLPATTANYISIEHKGETIDATSTLTLKNDLKESIQKLIFSLNDGLEISSVKVNDSETPFLREKHLVIISNNIALNPGDEIKVEITYSGAINEALCYLDIEEKTIQEKYGKTVVNVDKRYAFITPEYLLLTPESNWYPKAGVTYSSADVSWYQHQFIDFHLKVKTADGLKAISQGKISEISEGQFTFENEQPLTQLSLAIGNYKQKSMTIDSMDFGIWYIDGHDFFSKFFTESIDTIPSIIGERFEDFQRLYNLDYAFNRFSLVEVPAQLKTYERTWTSRQEMVQPEQILIPEKGYLIQEFDIKNQKKRMDRYRGRDDRGSDMTPKQKELRVIEDITRTFTSEIQRGDFRGGPGQMKAPQSVSPYFIFPMLYNFQNNIQSDEWPITNRIFEAYLKSQNMDLRSVFMSNMGGGENEDTRANIALQDSTFEEILADIHQKGIIDNVIKLKGDVLFSMIQWKAGQEEFKDFLSAILRENKFKNISFEVFNQRINDEFGIELIPMMDEWFKATTLPGYLFSPVKAVKVKSGDMMRTMVSLKATNFSDTEGLVKISFRLGGFGGPGGGRGGGRGGGTGGSDMIDKLVYLEPHQSKDLSYLLDADPRMVIINTMTSKNIPQTMMEFFREIEEDPKAIPYDGEKISDTPVQNALPGEIIVDNEDPEFEITTTENKSLLEKWIVKENLNKSKYTGVNYWRPPTNWTATTNSDFYGEYVRSAHYVKGGEGTVTAKWNVPIKKAGYYDVYFHYYKSRSFGRGRDNREEKGEYLFTIFGDDGAEEAAIQASNAEEGWNHLGSYYFAPDTAIIELSNKTELKMIFADAVRLVEQ